MRIETSGPYISRCIAAAIVALFLITLGGCGGNKQHQQAVAESLAHVGIAVEVAKTRETERYAAAEIGIAEEKLRAADQAVKRGNSSEAQRLLAEALVNVELAKAKAAAGRARAEVEELQADRGPPGNTR